MATQNSNSRFKNIWQALRRSVSAPDSSQRLAAGVALGLVIGLLPKDSALVLLAVVILICSRANFGTAIIAALCFHFIGNLINPLTHSIGLFVLTFKPLESLWSSLVQLPIVPWFRLNNSIVMGSLVLGIAAAWPAFRCSQRLFENHGAAAYDRIRNSRPARWLVGSKNSELNEGPV